MNHHKTRRRALAASAVMIASTLTGASGTNAMFGPTAIPDKIDVALTAEVPTSLPLVANDLEFNPGDPITISGEHSGDIVITESNSVDYYPSAIGPDQFTYTVCQTENSEVCESAAVTIYVTNDTEELAALDDEFSGPRDEDLPLPVVTNDAGFDSNDLITVIGPAQGDLGQIDDTTLVYTPTFVGTDSFRYVICKDDDPSVCSAADVTMTIGDPAPPTDAIVARNNRYILLSEQQPSYVLGLLNNDDNVTEATTIELNNEPDERLTIDETGVVRFAPGDPGVFTFDYTACNSPTNCSQATVSIETLPPCTHIGTGAADILIGTDEDDVMCSFGGRDFVDGRGGNDILVLGGGDDHGIGGPGDDRILARGGNDYVEGGEGSDELRLGAGDDHADGGPGADSIYAGNGDDFVDGSTGDDLLMLGAGDDRGYGSSGVDRILGGQGQDFADGGATIGESNIEIDDRDVCGAETRTRCEARPGDDDPVDTGNAGLRAFPEAPNGGPWVHIFGADSACGSTTDNEVYCVEAYYPDSTPDVEPLSMVGPVTTVDGDPVEGTVIDADDGCFATTVNLYCMRYDNFVITSDLGDIDPTTITTIASGHYNSGVCVIDDTQSAYCNRTFTSEGAVFGDFTQVAADLGGIVDIDTAFDQTCVIDSEGDAYCWGRARYGAVTGDASNSIVTTPFKVASGPSAGEEVPTPPILDEGDSYVSIHTGGQQTCARSVAGDVVCWGTASPAEIPASQSDDPGNAEKKSSGASYPASILGFGDLTDNEAIMAIDLGHYNACAYTFSGGAHCWGDDYNGGVTGFDAPAPVDENIPFQVLGTDIDFQHFDVGFNHSVIVDNGGPDLIWGETVGYYA